MVSALYRLSRAVSNLPYAICSIAFLFRIRILVSMSFGDLKFLSYELETPSKSSFIL